MPIETNLNISPYFNDYDEEKNFYKILFRPGVALQARELTQLQSIFQNQIEKFGDHVFKSGTIISGVNFQFNPKYDYVKILDNNVLGQPVIPADYNGLLVRNSSNLIAKIVNFRTGFQSQDPEMNYLYLKYLNSGATGVESGFANSDSLTIYSDNFKLFNALVNNGGSGFSNSDTVQITSALIVNSSNVVAGANITQTIGTSTSIVYVNEVNTTFGTITLNNVTYSNTSGYKLLKIRPNDVDLACTSFSTTRWSITSNNNVTQGVNTAFIVAAIGSGARATLTTDGSGILTDVSISEGGSNYTVLPDFRVRSSTGVLDSIDIIPQNYKDIVTVADSTFTGNGTAPVGNGYSFSVTEGIIYQKGMFVRVSPQTIIVNSYSSNVNNVAVGFTTVESIVNSNVDTALLDNATGSSNFAAPGADRLKLTPTLTVSNLTSIEANSTFFTLVEFKNGEPYKQNKSTIYNLISRETEQRTAESVGDYVIDPFVMVSKDRQGNSWSNTEIDLVIDPGVAYVSGRRVEATKNTYLPLRRSTDTRTATDNVISVNYGNYVIVNEYAGYFDTTTGAVVDLYGTAKQYHTSRSTTISPSGTKIGEARIRSIMFDSGTPGLPAANYRMYLYDVRMNSGRSFGDVRSVYNSAGSKGIADVVLDLNSLTGRTNARLKDTAFNNLVFPVGALGVKAVNNATYGYRSVNTSVSISTLGLTTLATADVFPYTNNASLSAVQRRDLILVPTANALSQNSVSSITATSTSNVISGTSLTATLQPGDWVYLESQGNTAQTLFSTVVVVSNTTHCTLSNAWSYATASDLTVARYFPAHAPIPLDDSRVSANVNISRNEIVINISNTAGVVSFASSLTAHVYYNANKVNVSHLNKRVKRNLFVKLNLSTHPSSNSGPWCLGIPDVFRLNNVWVATTSSVNTNSTDITRYFYVDNGQKNDYYSQSHLVLLNQSGVSLANNNYLLVSVDALDLNSPTDAGVFTVNSYPIAFSNDDRSTLANNFINIFEVPEFKTTKGELIDLRDAIDFRPRVVPTANVTSDVALATTNPANTVSFGTQDKLFPVPDSDFTYDYEFYLRRADRVIIDINSDIRVIEGVPAPNRVEPPPPQPDSITLGIVDIPPFPSAARIPDSTLVDYGAKKTGSESPIFYKPIVYTVNTRIADGEFEYQPKRFTMEDIGKLERRIEDLEYYTALSLLERKTKDLIVPSSIDPTINRFKNGFFVEQFEDYLQADTLSQEFTADIDQENGILGPLQATFNFQARFNYADSTTSNNLFNEDGFNLEPGIGHWGESVALLPVVESEIIVNQTKFTSAVSGDGTDTKFVGDISIQPASFKILLNAEVRLTGSDAGPAPAPKGGGGKKKKIICNKLFELGYLEKELNKADQMFGVMLSKKYPTIYNGYMFWAHAAVDLFDGAGMLDEYSLKFGMQQGANKWLAKKIAFIYADYLARPWSEEMARIMKIRENGSIEGKIVLYGGGFICWMLGKVGAKEHLPTSKSTSKKMAVWGVATLFLGVVGVTKLVKYPINKIKTGLQKLISFKKVAA